MNMENKNDDDDKPKTTVHFAPGCFDSFEGTPEELEQLIAELQKMAQDGEFDHDVIVGATMADDDIPSISDYAGGLCAD
jgi:hypothetical protein